ncbi:hypothetical protein ACQCVH_22410 [Bacillus infantis]|uniref:hypothetical protein n=1 Tax=Bacillus infantis TaxID=324767 RepID=UPI003CED195B
MLFSVDFDIRINESFCTVHTAFVPAESVSECMDIAEGMKETIPANKDHYVHIFIEQVEDLIC